MGYSVYYNGEMSVSPPLTEKDAAIVRAVSALERTEETRAVFATIAASSEPDLPGHAGLVEIADDRAHLIPEEGESRHGFGLWLRLLSLHFLPKRGYVLNGEVFWEGEDHDDSGCVYAKNNQIETVEDLIFNPGPSWAPNRYADDTLKQAVRHLLDSADNTGCSPDLTVVAAAYIETVRSRLPEY